MKEENKGKKHLFVCERCHSKLEVNEFELIPNDSHDAWHFDCPVCGKGNFICWYIELLFARIRYWYYTKNRKEEK